MPACGGLGSDVYSTAIAGADATAVTTGANTTVNLTSSSSPGTINPLTQTAVRCLIHQNVGLTDGSAHMLSPNQRIEKVEGKFKIVRTDIPTNPAPP